MAVVGIVYRDRATEVQKHPFKLYSHLAGKIYLIKLSDILLSYSKDAVPLTTSCSIVCEVVPHLCLK